ncbi:MAG: cation:proton antiporter [Legionellales bacterium]|nr:cation:proton antiporter [Legionellales bacterium]|tara:strand:+ start:43527 stop:43814 length:288 start_codon:yes stop_codon:yes gene_type:complete
MVELTCGILLATSLYLILDDSLWRRVFGITLLGNIINIILLYSGGLEGIAPAFVSSTAKIGLSNPLPQALILTAIVISFGLLVFLYVLIKVVNKP